MNFQEYILHLNAEEDSKESKQWKPIVTADSPRMLGLEVELPEYGLPHGVFYVPYFSLKSVLWKMNHEGSQYSQRIILRIAESSMDSEDQLGFGIFGHNLKALADAIAQEKVSHVYWGEDTSPSRQSPSIASIKLLLKAETEESEEEENWDESEYEVDSEESGFSVKALSEKELAKLGKRLGL